MSDDRPLNGTFVQYRGGMLSVSAYAARQLRLARGQAIDDATFGRVLHLHLEELREQVRAHACGEN